MRDWLAQRLRGGVNRLSALLRLPLGPLRRLRSQSWQGARSCNLAIWRADLDRVDGFDADYSGWGKEDSDIIVRLLRAGVRRKDGVFATGVLHLWHAEADRGRLAENERKLSGILADDRVRARQGLSALQASPSAAMAARLIRWRIIRSHAPLTACGSPTSPIGWRWRPWFRCRGRPRPPASWWCCCCSRSFRRCIGPMCAAQLVTAAGGLPVLLVVLGVAGMAWADVSLAERWSGLVSFMKLLLIPLLFAQFLRSERGWWVLGAFVLSCLVLLLAATVVQFVPGFSFIPMKYDHVLVKSAPTQSGEFRHLHLRPAVCRGRLLGAAALALFGRLAHGRHRHAGQHALRGDLPHIARHHPGPAALSSHSSG